MGSGLSGTRLVDTVTRAIKTAIVAVEFDGVVLVSGSGLGIDGQVCLTVEQYINGIVDDVVDSSGLTGTVGHDIEHGSKGGLSEFTPGVTLGTESDPLVGGLTAHGPCFETGRPRDAVSGIDGVGVVSLPMGNSVRASARTMVGVTVGIGERINAFAIVGTKSGVTVTSTASVVEVGTVTLMTSDTSTRDTGVVDGTRVAIGITHDTVVKR